MIELLKYEATMCVSTSILDYILSGWCIHNNAGVYKFAYPQGPHSILSLWEEYKVAYPLRVNA